MGGRIVVFFSRSGRTKAVAEGIARELGAPLEEIRLKKVKNRIPTPGMIVRRFRKGELPAVHTDFPDMGRFDEVILGGPTWAFDIAPPVLSFVEHVNWSGKRVHLFATEAIFGGQRAIHHLRQVLEDKGAHVEKEKVFPTLFRSRKALQLKGRDWAKVLRK
ncbi:MAG: NAD(P)H-dependent oxidoreductase [Candidatus Caldatribacterium sp.]|nr:NAD(P)H-dependent oxidoreductase [Candidatus Caldatribacterium sp.]